MRRTYLVLALLLALLLFLLGAWGRVGGGGGPSTSPGTGTLREVTREHNGIKLTLRVDKEKYGPDDTVNVKVQVENRNQTAVDYHGENTVVPGLTLTVNSVLAGKQDLGEPSPEQMAGTLDAGAKLKLERDWDLHLLIPNTGVKAPPGRYSINAGFLAEKPGFADLFEVAAVVTFDVEGTDVVLTPTDLLQAVAENEEVKAWAQTRGPNVVCVYPARDLFYNAFFESGLVSETVSAAYQPQADEGLPICGLAVEGDAWIVVMYGPKGGDPDRLTVRVALGTPDVLGVDEGGPAARPEATQ